MQDQSKILVWGACNFEKMPKNQGLECCGRLSKNQTKGDWDLKYGFKWSLGRALSGYQSNMQD